MRKLFQPLGNFPGFQLGNNTAAAALNSDLPATQFWADQNSLSSSHPFHSKADDAAWESPSDFGILMSTNCREHHNSVTLGTWRKLSAKTKAFLMTFYIRRGVSLVS